MQIKIPEKNKRAGVSYAVTNDGLELPVIDLTHPAFQISLDENELQVLSQRFLKDAEGPAKMPAVLRGLVFSFMSKRSVIMRGLMGTSGTFMSGTNTYMMKLGADNLNKSFFSEIDRRIAASPAGLFMRLRLQDMAQLLAEALTPVLNARPKASLHLLNIGGGPAMDSLNALITIQQKHKELLAQRCIFIHSLDVDTIGADFGARALAALLGEGCALHGLLINFEHISFNWSETTQLRNLIESFETEYVVGISSEGALFEYGSDKDIINNLQILNKTTPEDTVIVGSVTRADELGLKANGVGLGSRAALQFRGIEAFTAIANQSGWNVDRVIDRLLSHAVLLNKAK